MSIFSFPNQRISENKKNQEWHERHILDYLNYAVSNEYAQRRKEMAECYYIASAKLSPEKEKIVKATITECYGPNFGPKYEVYPLVESNIEQLMGQYRERPLRRRAIVRNEEAIIKKLDQKVSMIAESLLRESNEEIQSQLGFVPETENPDMIIPENIEEFFEQSYRTVSERIAEDIVHQLLVVKKGKEKIYNALYHYLVSETAFAVLDEKDGHPSLFIPHPLDCFSDSNPLDDIQSDLTYFVYDKFMSVNEILNTYDLSEKDKTLVESYSNIGPKDHYYKNLSQGISWYQRENGTTRPRVVSMMWLSRRKTNFKVITNSKTGKEEYKILPIDYKIRDRDDIVSIEIDDVRHVTMIGPSLTLSWGRLDSNNQLRTIGNDKKRFIPAIAIMGRNNAGVSGIRSLAKKLEWLQDFASDILYELKLSLRYIDGNVIVYDLSNIPKEFLQNATIDSALDKVKFHLKKDRMMLINSRDKKSANYASSVNVSQSKRLNDILVLLSTIETIAQKISGINENMQGQGNPYEKASVAEMRLVQASARVENYFGIFDSFIDVVCERMCIQARFIYRENQTFNYFAGDGSMRFLTIFPDFFLEDIGVYFDDNRKEFQKKRIIDQMAQETFARTQYPEMLEVLLKVLNSDTSNESEIQMKKGLRAYQKLQEENMKRQEEMQRQQLEAQSQMKQEDNNLKREGYQKDVVVANVYANSKQEETLTKEDAANRRKAAEIERDILLKSNNSKKP